MYEEIEKSKKLLKAGESDSALDILFNLLEKASNFNDREKVCTDIAKIYILKNDYTKAVEKLGDFFDDLKMSIFLDNIDEYITENNKDRVKNILLNNFEIFKKKIILKSKPSSMLVILTEKCNLKCIMCESVKNNYTVPENVLTDIINHMKYFERLTCLGGEVFLYDKFNVLVENAKKFDAELGICTNALLLGKNISMFENMKASIGVSVDGFDKDTYEKIRINGNFDVLTENLEILKQSIQKESFKQTRTLLHVVIMNINYKQIRQAFDFALKYNFGALNFLKLNSSFQYMPNEQEMEYAICQINECMDIIEKEKYNIQIFTDPNLNVFRENQKNLYNNNNIKRSDLGIRCNVPWKNIAINSDSDVYFECRCDCKHFEKFETIEKSWNGLPVQSIRQAIIDGNYIEPCKDCSILY
ncbi:MAG: radical SAM protein [Endomicrobiaceae bacterium]|nr:radical SAM protein [Endomicrobiaceae bacterium]